MEALKENLTLKKSLTEGLRILSPSWPLQSTVAVNPFWNLRERGFCDVMSQLNPVLHQQLLMPMQYFRDKYSKGLILDDSLAEALEENRKLWPHLPDSVPELVNMTWGKERFSRKVENIAEIDPVDNRLFDFVIDEIGKFASAYFDENQALIKFPWKKHSFWQGWIKSQKYDRSLSISGFENCILLLEPLADLQPEDAIQRMLLEMGVTSKAGQTLYLQRATANVIGWGSLFQYYQWQKSLGYTTPTCPLASELVAVRVAYDYLIFKNRFSAHESLYKQWASALNSLEVQPADHDEFFGVVYTWHLALELSYQTQVASSLSMASLPAPIQARNRLIFCIDVRSEMIRRHIETVDRQTLTSGFAGFFAAAIEFQKSDENTVGRRLPVLLTPAISVTENAQASTSVSDSSRPAIAHIFVSYFRNLRKLSLSSFLFVELFGIISIFDLLRKSLRSLLHRNRLPSRFEFSSAGMAESQALNYASKKPLTVEEKAAFAANALRHMGLKENFAKLNVIVGHGAETYNNAFASALDCGACGGHAGDVNARFLVSLLNAPEVRTLLEQKSIFIPKQSWFTPAVHETVTDDIHLLDEENIPATYSQDLLELKKTLQKASENCRNERQTARSNCLDLSAKRRSTNWSEVRPEWGLSGNACFVVAPRARSIGVNLSSRAFLHDYDWTRDEEFKTLELIMTAPMVVTNWINMQYFGSVVAPKFYGSGNKILHNLINEVGVVEGNGGDLRIGLPMQSVHDGEKFVHDPIRLSVFIEAPRDEIEKIITKHAVVGELVNNQWLHIIQIESANSRIWRRLTDGTYSEIMKTISD